MPYNASVTFTPMKPKETPSDKKQSNAFISHLKALQGFHDFQTDDAEKRPGDKKHSNELISHPKALQRFRYFYTEDPGQEIKSKVTC